MNDIEITQDPNNALMAQVLASGNIEVLEKYVALKEREEARQATIEFDRYFSAMQSEFGAVVRDKKGFGYMYAPIESLQKQYGPIIAKHGFSYAWTEEPAENGIRCTMTIYGHGSSRSNSMVVPSIGTNKQMNAAQSAGALSTYARRYTFVAGLGVVLDNEDTDAQTERDPVALIAPTQALKDCKDAEALKSAWASIYTKHRGDSYEIKQLTAVYTEMKGKLS